MEHLLDLLIRPMAFFVAYPGAAALLGGLFFVVARWTPQRVGRGMAVVWLLYAVYETSMKQRWLCSGECNIRIDLFVIASLLLPGSAAAVVRIWRAHRTKEGRARPAPVGAKDVFLLTIVVTTITISHAPFPAA